MENLWYPQLVINVMVAIFMVCQARRNYIFRKRCDILADLVRECGRMIEETSTYLRLHVQTTNAHTQLN